MKAWRPWRLRLAVCLFALSFLFPHTSCGANAQVLGWNNLGMHCIDSDYSVFSILPPYNTIEAQLIVGGLLVTNGGYTVTYQAVADPTGSFNSTSAGKGNFYSFVFPLYGANLPVDAGLLTWGMPGLNNTPQGMLFEQTNTPVPPLPGVTTPVNWWRAEGIPLSPYDDALRKNPYPLMLLVARDAGNNILATNQIVLPISDEMDCRACHASGTQTPAEPLAGWVWDGLPERDFRLNILRLHDERQFSQFPGLYQAALAARGFNPQGLYRNVTADGKPVLCAACHADVALNILNSYSNIPPFTASMHGFHGHVMDPASNTTLDNLANRSACYRCHPGSMTRCLRGAMGGAIAADGSMEMQCQSCHGNMSLVGSTNRTGWLDEPLCQSCHSGTAVNNNGQIRYTSVFTDTNWTVRTAVDQTFAINNLALYRFSVGHGGLQCEACHGSTHAEFPSTHLNDNLRNIQIQGHAGMMIECTACHVSMPNTANGGPHGMHTLGQNWIGSHGDLINSLPGGVTACAICHGTDYRGTVLSRAQADRTLIASFDTVTNTVNLYRGTEIGCYLCHNGPGNSNPNNSVPPAVSNVYTNTANDRAVAMILPATGSSLTLSIISQATNGSVGLSNNVATYFPNPGSVGTDTFTFAAYDGNKNSNLGTGTVSVAQGPYSISAVGYVPPSYPANWPAPFAVVPAVSNNAAPVTYDWNFGDNTPHGTNQFATHTYQLPGTYIWTVIATVSGNSSVDAGLIVVGNPVRLNIARAGGSITVSWPNTIIDTMLRKNDSLASPAQWLWVTNALDTNSSLLSVTLSASGSGFFRVERPW
ncbi:MAG TPA: PKD domain-containing protein [Verrucomicrobiae bacterium]|nr:PKD domain-containing protein [Verrucomicrobiae bacterium]